jgi:cbb3-type cytochrome oxidase maturation protein
MNIIIILIAISLSIAILFLVIFYWNMKSGQYDDTYTPSVRILFDNKVSQPKNRSSEVTNGPSQRTPKANFVSKQS